MKKTKSTDNANTTGLIAWLDNTRVVLPLKGVETRFSITGPLAQVEMDQIYFQDNKKPLDVTYTFPLPDGASVYRCELHTNDRVIKAKVKAVDEAREIAAEGKKKGHRTMLVEEVRGNLFELNLGLLMPGDTAIIRMAWFQQMEQEDGLHSLRLPFTPGVRYIPGSPLLRQNKGKGSADDTDRSPDASRLTPPRIDSLHPDAAYIHVAGTMENMDADAIALTSPTHVLSVSQKESSIILELAGKGEVPDRDLIIRYRPPQAQGPIATAWSTREGDNTYALVQFTAPALPENIPFVPSDVYFLLDRSGSMSGENWSACSKAFRGFLNALDARDRVWVTFFESEFMDLAEKPLPPAAILAEPVVKNLENWPTGGGTELWPALQHVLAKTGEFSRKRRKIIVLITDGQVGDEAKITKDMQNYPDVILHTFGIDRAVNDSFLKELARQQGGLCTLRTPQEDVEGAITGLAKQLGTPALSELSFEGPWEAPRPIRTSLAGNESITFVLRHSGPNIGGLFIKGLTASREPISIEAMLQDNSSHQAIPLLWKKQRIDTLLADDETESEAVALACEAGLLCRGTAFVAVDEAERFIGTSLVEHLYQPSVLQDTGRVARSMSAPMFSARPSPARFLKKMLSRREIDAEDLCMDAVPPIMLDVDHSMVCREFVDDTPPAPPAGGSLISSRGPSWITELPVLMGGDPVLARAFAEWLDQWMESDPAKADARREAIQQLLTQLALFGPTDSFTPLEHFLNEADFAQSPFHSGALAALAEWKQTLPVA
jgi:Ca-activated chloride channel homolog